MIQLKNWPFEPKNHPANWKGNSSEILKYLNVPAVSFQGSILEMWGFCLSKCWPPQKHMDNIYLLKDKIYSRKLADLGHHHLRETRGKKGSGSKNPATAFLQVGQFVLFLEAPLWTTEHMVTYLDVCRHLTEHAKQPNADHAPFFPSNSRNEDYQWSP